MNSADRFESIVDDHYEPLYRFAMSLTRSESDAGDLTQHTFYVWATKGHQLRDISKVKTWLFTILHRTFLEGRRRQTRFSHCELSESENELIEAAPEIVSELDHFQMLGALAQVDEGYRAAVALFYLEDSSYKDIAEILQIPIGTVKSRISRGLGQLREILLSDNLSSSPVPDETSNRFGNSLSLPRQPVKSAVSEADYDEWDFSSTLLREQLGMA